MSRAGRPEKPRGLDAARGASPCVPLAPHALSFHLIGSLGLSVCQTMTPNPEDI